MSTTDLGIVPTPKPGPVIPNRVPVRGAGVNQDDVEARSRIIAMILPYSKDAIRSVDDMLAIADYIEHGDDEEDES